MGHPERTKTIDASATRRRFFRCVWHNGDTIDMFRAASWARHARRHRRPRRCSRRKVVRVRRAVRAGNDEASATARAVARRSILGPCGPVPDNDPAARREPPSPRPSDLDAVPVAHYTGPPLVSDRGPWRARPSPGAPLSRRKRLGLAPLAARWRGLNQFFHLPSDPASISHHRSAAPGTPFHLRRARMASGLTAGSCASEYRQFTSTQWARHMLAAAYGA